MAERIFFNLWTYMRDNLYTHIERTTRRLFMLLALFIAAFIIHKVLADFDEELLGSIILMVLFSLGLIYDYGSLFRRKLPKIEYIIAIVFIIVFTILMFSTIYSEKMNGGSSYFIENGQNLTKLSFSDAMYFSATTLTTTAYGDILPVGAFRFFAVIEVFFGFIYIGTMVYIITRIFSEK